MRWVGAKASLVEPTKRNVVSASKKKIFEESRTRVVSTSFCQTIWKETETSALKDDDDP